MNEARQTQDVAAAWNDVQQKMRDYWMSGLESVVRPPYLEAWQRSANTMIDACADSVNRSLQAQLDWTGSWNQAQRELWDVMFLGLRNFGPATFVSRYLEVSKTWQEAARKTLDTQLEATRRSTEEGVRAAASTAQEASRALEQTAKQGERAAAGAKQQGETVAAGRG